MAANVQDEDKVDEYVQRDETNIRLAQILKAVNSQIPDGYAEFASITVNPPLFVLDPKAATAYNLRGPWYACDVTNDGTADLQYSVNEGVTKDTVKSGDTREVNMKAKGKLYQLVFYPTVATPIRLAFIR
jgi:hypothetical protein